MRHRLDALWTVQQVADHLGTPSALFTRGAANKPVPGAFSWPRVGTITWPLTDDSGIAARLLADRIWHSRVSMTQDASLGRRAADPRVVAALELAGPSPTREKWGKAWIEP